MTLARNDAEMGAHIMGKWKLDWFARATSVGVMGEEGWSYRHLGLYEMLDEWCLIHLNSGLGICWIKGPKRTAFKYAAEVAECADWSFAAMNEWQTTDPDIPLKVEGIIGRSGGKVFRKGTAAEHRKLAKKIAAEVLRGRAA